VFLLRQSQVQAFETKLLSGSDVVPLATPLEGRFVAFSSPARVPPWATAVLPLLTGGVPQHLESQSPSAILSVTRGNRVFVITFGHAWQKLESKWLEPDFGRRVVLNSIARNQLVEIRAEQVFAKWHLASERAPRASSVEEFGVEFDRDLVAVVEGTPSDKSLGKTLRGGTNLRVSIPVSTLGPSLDKASSLFDSNVYKKIWPEVDNLSPVTDIATISALESRFDSELTSGHAQKSLVLVTPTLRRGENVLADSYVFGNMSKAPAFVPYLTVDSWLNHVAKVGKTATIADAKTTRVHMMDDAKDELLASTVFECFGYELTLNGTQYVLSSGIWYEVAANFIAKINALVKAMPAPKLTLLPWNGVESEGQYNQRVSTALKCLNFDTKNIYFGGGQSRFEFCDFMHKKTKTLYFAKIASKSSGMSHLVEQVHRTAELLFSSDGAYRRKLAKVFVAQHPKEDVQWLDSRPKTGDLNLCFVSLGRPALKLPFFGRCGLAKAYEDLRERGHDVSFTSV
jgi:uncharacterized protein (TIGR04141 family)